MSKRRLIGRRFALKLGKNQGGQRRFARSRHTREQNSMCLRIAQKRKNRIDLIRPYHDLTRIKLKRLCGLNAKCKIARLLHMRVLFPPSTTDYNLLARLLRSHPCAPASFSGAMSIAFFGDLA